MLELAGITKSFGDLKAVNSVSLKIKKGEMLGLVGPNGSGKSTLLKILLGISRPTEGSVFFNGRQLTGPDWTGLRKGIGYMPERVAFYDNLTGKETLELFRRVKGGAPGNSDTILKKVGLEASKDRKVGGYSKGMRQRLNMAQALSNDPDLLILDEPTSGLDPVGTREFYEILGDARGRKSITIVLSSHILAEIEDKIDRAAIMKAGELRALGSLEELYSGFNLPLRISLALKERDEPLIALLNSEGGRDIEYKDGYLTAGVSREDKLKVLSAIMESKSNFDDLSMREPNLEEVFFGVH